MKSISTRMANSKRYLIPSIVALALLFCAFAALPRMVQAQGRAEIMIENKSHWDIYKLYLSPSDNRNWGPDQLGNKVIKSGTSFTLHSIPCNDYDIKIVDEDGDSCVITNVNMCRDHTHWTLTDNELLSCENSE